MRTLRQKLYPSKHKNINIYDIHYHHALSIFTICDLKFLGWYVNLRMNSIFFSGSAILSYLLRNLINAILDCSKAMCFPMHALGPPLNPINWKGG